MPAMTRSIAFVPAVLAVLALGPAQAANMVCAVDLNGDGSIDQSTEIQSCTNYTAAGAGTVAGYLCPMQSTACQVNTSGAWACPLGSQYSCMGSAGNTPMCSPNTCVDSNNAGGTSVPVMNNPTPTSTGPTNSTTGACTGHVQVFAGRAASCRGQGVDTAFQDCCKANNTVHDTMGATSTNEQKPMLASVLSSVIPLYPSCSQSETQTGLEEQSNLCVHIGDYCTDSWPLVGCVQQAHAFCCFSSVLAQIIQTQGRQQLPAMGGFGTAQSPNCRGFTPAEFQSIDFSRIDLSSYYTQLEYRSQSTIQSELNTSGVPAHQ